MAAPAQSAAGVHRRRDDDVRRQRSTALAPRRRSPHAGPDRHGPVGRHRRDGHARFRAASLGYGTLAASLALALGVVVLKLQAGRARWFPALLQVLLSANMAVPGLILGAGYVIAFNNDFLPLYGTVLLLIIAYTAGALPIAIRLMGTAIGQLDKKLDEAARIFALPSLVRLIDIEAALLAKPGLYAWLLVTASVMYELPISELLYVPGATPLGVAIVSADMMAEYGQAAAWLCWACSASAYSRRRSASR